MKFAANCITSIFTAAVVFVVSVVEFVDVRSDVVKLTILTSLHHILVKYGSQLNIKTESAFIYFVTAPVVLTTKIFLELWLAIRN